MKHWQLAARALLICQLLVLLGSVLSDHPHALAVVSPVADRSRLALNKEGIEYLRSVTGPVVPVVVIGPYRSGKSFLLNQLLDVPCGTGFGVGHTRKTETKGVWVWGDAQPLQLPNGDTASMLYFDTEGFESTGKADAYDDRIFALSTIVSAVLIYNLPETLRESDLEKLSFAVELANGFYRSNNDDGVPGGKPPAIEPGSMLWVVQRDFLQGNTVDQMVHDALLPVANPHNDKDIAQVNRIRDSLRVIARNSTAMGLPQPHINRTALCEMTDADFDGAYVSARDSLRALVRELAMPKSLNGVVLDGPRLADLIEKMVMALNSRDLPSAVSMVEAFNKDLMFGCRQQYIDAMTALTLPAHESELQQLHDRAQSQAMQRFDTESFGVVASSKAAGNLRDQLLDAISKEYIVVETSNMVASGDVCEKATAACEDLLERLQRMKLPSVARFEAKYAHCYDQFKIQCFGPALQRHEDRLTKALNRELSRFKHDFNDKLLTGLVGLALTDIVIARFIFKQSLLELLGWVVFMFLEVFPRVFVTASFYDSVAWQRVVFVWELVVYNPIIDLEQWWLVLLAAIVAAYLTKRFKLLPFRRKKINLAKKKDFTLDDVV